MSGEPDDAEWARSHRACYQVAPLLEARGTERIHVGFTIDLYAGFPVEKGPGADRIAESEVIWQRLRSILRSLVTTADAQARLEIEPPRAAAYMRPENEMRPEVGLRARVFHGDDYFKAVSTDDRTRLSAFEKRLSDKGLRSGHW